MSKGCIIFANKTDLFDYDRLANMAAVRVTKHLGLPVTILTTDAAIDNIRTLPGNVGNFSWKNLGRTHAYALSPYDRTLIIDADFFVASDALLPHINGSFEFGIIRDMYNPATGEPFVPTLGYSKIQQLWSTIMIFDKCDLSAKIFETADNVLNHYPYYSKLYNFNPSPIRNDYAFTIACHLMGGYGQEDFSLKYTMNNCDFNAEILEINDDDVLIRYPKGDKQMIQRFKNMDLHLQNKISLFECLNV
jgi:hypothetical protein